MEFDLREMVGRREVGSLMIALSIGVMIFSGYTVHRLQELQDEAVSLERDMEEAILLLESGEFQTNLEILEGIETSDIGQELRGSTEIMRDSAETFREHSEFADRLEEDLEMFQWIFLFSVLGFVAGITTILI